MSINPIHYCVTEETGEIVDLLMNDFLRKCIGKNDMSFTSALFVSAALMLVTHCKRTGQDLDELADLCRIQFDAALDIAREKAKP